MKTFKLIFGATLTLLVLCLSSCTDENSEMDGGSANAIMSKASEADSLAIVYTSIKTSSTYETYINAIKLMCDKLRYQKPPMTTKADFSSWLTSNLNKTDFGSVEEGEALYDLLNTEQQNLFLKYRNFFEAVSRLSRSDIRVVIASDMPPRPTITTQGDPLTPCQNTVLDMAGEMHDSFVAEHESCLSGSIFGLADWYCNWTFTSSMQTVSDFIGQGMAACG